MTARHLGLCGVWLGALLGATASPAQPPAFQPPAQTEIVFDGTLGPAGQLPPSFLFGSGLGFGIPDTAGRRSKNGEVLFHSFGTFDVATGDVVLFGGSPEVRDVVARITGGGPSRIDGFVASLVDPALPLVVVPDPDGQPLLVPNFVSHANLYLLNPEGVLFGPNASVQVGGSLYVSSAHELRFGESFALPTGDGETDLSGVELDVADPTAFGFLGGDVALLSSQGQLIAENVTLAGGDVFIQGDGDPANPRGSVAATQGSIRIASVASAGDVLLDAADFEASARHFAAHGSVDAGSSASVCAGNGCSFAPGLETGPGDIAIVADTVAVREASRVIARRDFGQDHGGRVAIATHAADAAGAEPSLLVDGRSTVAALSSAAGSDEAGGKVEIDTQRLWVRGGSRISAGAAQLDATPVDGGSVHVTASQWIVLEGAPPGSPDAPLTEISTVSREGEAGSVVVDAPGAALVVHGLAGVFATKLAGGSEPDAGSEVDIHVRDLLLEQGGQISTNTYGTATAAPIRIEAADSIRLRDGGFIQARSLGDGDGAPITLTAGREISIGAGAIESQTGGAGDAGSVTLDAPRIRIEGGAVLAGSDPGAEGRPGDILLLGDSLRIRNGGIGATSLGSADAGTVRIGTPERPFDRVRISHGSIATAALTAGGGDVFVYSDDLILENQGAISASVVTGDGGSVEVVAPDFVQIDPSSRILARAVQRGGRGGRIEIDTGAFFGLPETLDVSAPGGPEVQGRVEVRSPEVDVDAALKPLRVEYLDAAAQLRPTCAVRAAAGPSGSFSVARRRGLPTSPEDLLLAFDRIGLEPEAPAPVGVEVAEASLSEGALAFRGGHFEEAADQLERASALYAEAGEAGARAGALGALAQSQQALGRFADSLATLDEALSLAEAAGDTVRIASLHGDLGNAYLALGDAEAAEQQLERGIELAEQAGNASSSARLHNNLGNLHAARGRAAAALTAYQESARRASEAKLSEVEAKALSNAARAALAAGERELAADLLGRAHSLSGELPPSHERAFLEIHIAGGYAELAAASPLRREASLLAAHEALTRAAATARELGDPRSLSYALGRLGSLYAGEQRIDEALYLTRRAQDAAREAGASEALYRWYRQEGRLLWAQGAAGASLAAHRRAVAILEETRQETLARYGDAAHFRRVVAPAYLDYVDVLLQSSAQVPDRAAAGRLLLEARATMEELKAAELRDYFRDDCVAEIEARRMPLESVASRAAVVYPILLPDRLELLVSLPDGIERHSVPVPAEKVDAEVERFRQLLEKRTTEEYRPHAERLYDWLVRPIEARLEASQVSTLVLVPDGSLRTIPLAALHDGERFLVERWALAVAPGLSLVDPQPLDLAEARLLLAGLDEPAQGFAELPNAAREIQAIHELYGGEVLLGEDFGADHFERELGRAEPSVVHVASHAVFTGDVASSYIVTHDGRVTLDGLAGAVAPTGFRAQPLELLTLSACETAAGDERAALGLAGVAVRSGARSALGTLWSVEDESGAELVVAFYAALGEPGVSKAEALRRAQLGLLENPRFSHPAYWAPFLLISNWL